MSGNPSRYGGVAGVLIFGIGLLAVGKTWVGVAVLVLGVLAMAIALSPSASGRAFFAGVGALILGGALVYLAASNEFTGTATYFPVVPKGAPAQHVTREGSPVKFREATNFLWAGSILSLIAAGVAFRFWRKLDNSATDF